MNKLHSAFLATKDVYNFIRLCCNEPFTVKHFLISCAEFNYIRTKYFNVKTIKELFNDIPTKKILDFLKEIGLFNKI